MPDEVVSLTKGSRYRIESMETRERTKVTKGIFRGYATIGTDDAILIELDESHQEMKGKLRLIPLHVILAVDIMEQVPGEAPKVAKSGTMYGSPRARAKILPDTRDTSDTSPRSSPEAFVDAMVGELRERAPSTTEELQRR